MAYAKKGIYHFRAPSEYGVNLMPLNRAVFIESTGVFYSLNSDAGLSGTSTVQDAIDNGNLIPLSVDGSGSGDLLADGSIPMSSGYTPIVDQDIATKSSVEDAIAASPNGGGNLLSDGSIEMDAAYTPTADQDIATKVSVEDAVAAIPGGGNLKSDGSIEMDAAYTPTADQDIATKVSVEDAVAAGPSPSGATQVMFELSMFDSK